MGKKKGKETAGSSKSAKIPYGLIFGVVAIVAAVVIYFYSGSSAPSQAMQQMQDLQESNPATSEYLAQHPNLRNRLILPAIPHETRPVTLPPPSFPEGEIRQSYQAAKDHPEALEKVACYCGCYGEGHRNNLDCYKDNHGVT